MKLVCVLIRAGHLVDMINYWPMELKVLLTGVLAVEYVNIKHCP